MNSGGAVEDTGGGLGGPLPVVVYCDYCGRRLKHGIEYGPKLYGKACLQHVLGEEQAAFMAKQIPLIPLKQKPPHQLAMEQRHG